MKDGREDGRKDGEILPALMIGGGEIAQHDLIDALLREYDEDARSLREFARVAGSLGKYAERAVTMIPHVRLPLLADTFSEQALMRSLDAVYWGRLVHRSKLEWILPRAVYEEIRRQIAEQETPTFSRDAVVSTMMAWAEDAPRCIARKVDDLFSRLSRAHKTNKASRFSDRLILDHVYSCGSSIVFVGSEHDVHDLRSVVALFLSYDMPCHGDTHDVARRAGNDPGRWIDDPTLPIRYRGYPKSGTLHVRIDPRAVDRMNEILASVRKNALPEKRSYG